VVFLSCAHFDVYLQKNSKEIDVTIRKIERLQASLAHWRTKISQNRRECQQRNQALREEKDAISAHFQVQLLFTLTLIFGVEAWCAICLTTYLPTHAGAKI
jgi:predicted  nucleic acid-binding Zn-ribbon protein